MIDYGQQMGPDQRRLHREYAENPSEIQERMDSGLMRGQQIERNRLRESGHASRPRRLDRNEVNDARARGNANRPESPEPRRAISQDTENTMRNIYGDDFTDSFIQNQNRSEYNRSVNNISRDPYGRSGNQNVGTVYSPGRSDMSDANQRNIVRDNVRSARTENSEPRQTLYNDGLNETLREETNVPMTLEEIQQYSLDLQAQGYGSIEGIRGGLTKEQGFDANIFRKPNNSATFTLNIRQARTPRGQEPCNMIIGIDGIGSGAGP